MQVCVCPLPSKQLYFRLFVHSHTSLCLFCGNLYEVVFKLFCGASCYFAPKLNWAMSVVTFGEGMLRLSPVNDGPAMYGRGNPSARAAFMRAVGGDELNVAVRRVPMVNNLFPSVLTAYGRLPSVSLADALNGFLYYLMGLWVSSSPHAGFCFISFACV